MQEGIVSNGRVCYQKNYGIFAADGMRYSNIIEVPTVFIKTNSTTSELDKCIMESECTFLCIDQSVKNSVLFLKKDSIVKCIYIIE